MFGIKSLYIYIHFVHFFLIPSKQLYLWRLLEYLKSSTLMLNNKINICMNYLVIIFSSPGSCEVLPSLVVRPLTFHILIYSSETTGTNGTKTGRKHLYKVLYKISSFRPIPPTNMAAKGNSCFWLANGKKIFSSETAWPNGAKFGRKHLCKIFYKTSSFGSIRPTNMAAVTKNRTYGKIARFW